MGNFSGLVREASQPQGAGESDECPYPVVEAKEVYRHGRGIQLKLKTTITMTKRCDLVSDKVIRCTQHPFGNHLFGCVSCPAGNNGTALGGTQCPTKVAK